MVGVARQKPPLDGVLEDLLCEATVFVGAIVKTESAVIKNALADGVFKSNAIGICIAKSSSTLCTVQLTAATPDIFSALDQDKDYFLSSTVAGAITTTPPSGQAEVVLRVGRPLTDKKMIVMIGQRMQRAT